tara:strand:+ start:847 stop:1215 length:369 start_codon:yes stop_codon:yes gene_type:complete
MPRARKVAKGQQYGMAKAQEESQKIQPMLDDTPMMPEKPRVKPGDINLTAPTTQPNQGSFGPASAPNMKIGLTDEERAKVATLIPVMSAIASTPHASRHMRSFLRRAKAQIGDVSDFSDKGL